MRATEAISNEDVSESGRPTAIASWRHTAGFIAIMVLTAAAGFMGQYRSTGTATPDAAQLASHGAAIPVYLTALAMDWLLFYFCWLGVHWHGGRLKALTGGRWATWRELASDVLVTLPFWLLWEAAAYGTHWLLGPSDAKSISALLPQSAIEVLLWIGLSITAGFCEEVAFRGYLQRQLHAVSGSVVVAIFGQAVIFGIAHGYQGFENVVVIVVLGVLYGALAAWRRNLRANMIAHGWSDLWEGWLKQVIG